jgi:hypothetical protein
MLGMAHFQELCRVRVWWLQPGHVCLKSKLGLDEYSDRNVVARFEGSSESAWRPVNNETSLRAMLSPTLRFLLDGGCSAENPLVQVRLPAVVYEFDLAGTVEGWLGSELVDRGAGQVFSPHLNDLDMIADYLARQGQAVDRGCWGTSVCFHTLWLVDANVTPPGLSFAGFLDLTRVPLGLFAERPPVDPSPAKVAAAQPKR